MQYLKYSDENWSSFVSPYDFVVGVIKRREGAKYYGSFEHIISKLTVYLPVLILNFARWGGGGVYNYTSRRAHIASTHRHFLPTCLMLCLYSLIPNIILYALII